VNQPAAEDLLFSGRSLAAGEAKAVGLVQGVYDDPEHAALDYFEKHLAPRSASSLGFAVRAARVGMLQEVHRRIAAVEKLYLEGLMATHDAKEGLAAFLAKRAPAWEHT
jgi:cyclohexa-1,5-dienecarbonyl-CoA hydratase